MDEVILVELNDELPFIRGEFDVWAINDEDEVARLRGTFRADLAWSCWTTDDGGKTYVDDSFGDGEFCEEVMEKFLGREIRTME